MASASMVRPPKRGQPTRDDVQLPLVVGRYSRDGEVADARARGDLGGGAARLPQELRECKLESVTATRQAPGRTTREEVVSPRVQLGTTPAARRSGGKLQGQPAAKSQQERHRRQGERPVDREHVEPHAFLT